MEYCCGCKKSQCLKRYCECFRRGKMCTQCPYPECKNNVDNVEERNKEMLRIIEKDPDAFKQKNTSR